ncbi:hypothetical protein ACSSS7_006873 [Eimeria intestinalis]
MGQPSKKARGLPALGAPRALGPTPLRPGGPPSSSSNSSSSNSSSKSNNSNSNGTSINSSSSSSDNNSIGSNSNSSSSTSSSGSLLLSPDGDTASSSSSSSSRSKVAGAPAAAATRVAAAAAVRIAAAATATATTATAATAAEAASQQYPCCCPQLPLRRFFFFLFFATESFGWFRMEADGRYVVLVSSDGEEIKVPREVASASLLVKSMTEDGDDTDTIPLPKVSSAILKKVVDYCTYHHDNPPEEIPTPLKTSNLAEGWGRRSLRIEGNRGFFALVRL